MENINEKFLLNNKDFEIKTVDFIENNSFFIVLISKIIGRIKKTDKENIIYIFLGNLMFSLSNLCIKIMTKIYPKSNGINVSFFRFSLIATLSYFFLHFLKIKLIPFKEIEKKKLFFYRILTSFMLSFSLTNSIFYLRYGTAISLSRSTPLFTSIISVIILKEKCLLRYLVGLVTGIISIVLFGFGDMKKDLLDQNKDNDHLVLGLFWSFINIFCGSSGVLVTKILVKDLDQAVMIFYLGTGGVILSLFFLILFRINLIFCPGFIIISLICGFFHFCGLLLNLSNVKSNQLLLVQSFSFMPILYAFIFGIVLFGETVSFSDLIGFSMLLTYSIYNVKNPPKMD